MAGSARTDHPCLLFGWFFSVMGEDTPQSGLIVIRGQTRPGTLKEEPSRAVCRFRGASGRHARVLRIAIVAIDVSRNGRERPAECLATTHAASVSSSI